MQLVLRRTDVSVTVRCAHSGSVIADHSKFRVELEPVWAADGSWGDRPPCVVFETDACEHRPPRCATLGPPAPVYTLT